MIHLHRLIKQLINLIESSSDLYSIESKCNDIATTSLRLVDEHGGGSDVNIRLKGIRDLALEIHQYCESRHGIPVRVEYGGIRVKAIRMEAIIGEIGKILKIEFKETQT